MVICLYKHIASTLATDTDDSYNGSAAWLGQCDPIIVTFSNSDPNFYITDNYTHFPQCTFYNESTLDYSEIGCYLVSYTNITSTCACRHSTYYGVQWEDFTPEINFLDSRQWGDVSFINLIKHPLGWVVVLTWIFVCLFFIALFNYHKKTHSLGSCCDKMERIVDRPLIATMQTHVLMTKEEKLKYRNIQEIRLIKDDLLKHRSFCVRFYNLFKLNIRNDHLWLGICCRDYGTNFTFAQRIAICMVRLLTSLSIAALFYGRAETSPIGDFSLS